LAIGYWLLAIGYWLLVDWESHKVYRHSQLDWESHEKEIKS